MVVNNLIWKILINYNREIEIREMASVYGEVHQVNN